MNLLLLTNSSEKGAAGDTATQINELMWGREGGGCKGNRLGLSKTAHDSVVSDSIRLKNFSLHFLI